MHEAPKGDSASHTSGEKVQPSRPLARRAFLSEPYVATPPDGSFRPVQGLRQCAQAQGAEPCALRQHGWRSRKTGPCFDLLVMACGTHPHFFTVYPSGFVPYGRQLVGPVEVSGDPIAADPASPREEWRITVFRWSAGGRGRDAVAAGRLRRRLLRTAVPYATATGRARIPSARPCQGSDRLGRPGLLARAVRPGPRSQSCSTPFRPGRPAH